VEQVEILTLLSGEPVRPWTAAEVFRKVQSSERSVVESLAGFCKGELLSCEPAGTYRFAPKDPDAGKLVKELAAAYRERRVTVIEAIYGKGSDPLQDFSDAFRLKKEQ
jgi:hypothetical protein